MRSAVGISGIHAGEDVNSPTSFSLCLSYIVLGNYGGLLQMAKKYG